MKKKTMGILVCTLLITATLLPVIATACGITTANEEPNAEIFKEIGETEDKILSTDTFIGEIHVKYWEHYIDDILVQGDSILLHLDVENDNVIKYEKTWTDVEIILPDYGDKTFESQGYFWKQKVVFPDEDDCGFFYTFYDPQEYPLVCWEVRHTDGTTITYSLDGEKIGHGIPAPYKGFSLSGYNTPSDPDPWIQFRQNADSWFQKWCTSTTSLSLPTPATISLYVSDSTVKLFYELAHGDEWRFQADTTGSYYYSSGTGYNVQSDMSNRQPMTFAFIGSCHGMTTTGPGTFSYEFRKGQMTGTVTVGYDHMETCLGWQFAYQWQDYMFNKINQAWTIKAAFDVATAQYPFIAPAVVFVGDVNLKPVAAPEINAQSSVEESVSNTCLENMATTTTFMSSTACSQQFNQLIQLPKTTTK